MVASDDIVLVTTGSQAADMSPGKMDEPPGPPPHPGQSWALWKTLAGKHRGFGNPDAFFGDPRITDSRWVTFTVTTTGTEFLDEITNLTHSGTGSGGLLTLQDFELDNLAVDLRAAGSPQPTARHIGVVGLWALSGAQRQLYSETHV